MAFTVIPTVVDGDDLTDDFTLGVKTAVGELQAMVTSGVATSTTFTPSFSNVNGGTSPTLVGRYWRFGPIGIVHVELTLGTGGGATGTIGVTSLPLTFLNSMVGSAWAYDVSPGTQYPGVVIGSGAALTQINFPTGPATGTVPFTWAATDQLRLTITGLVA